MGKGKWWVLGGILVIAAILRLVWLDKYPAGFTPDEAAFGYNAYSLLKTGHDEWGIPFWQLPHRNLRSFGDYKMPLYAFLTVPSVAVFGLSEFSARLPNAILGILAVVVIYVLGRRTGNHKLSAEIAGLLLAISPWALPLSRGAFEANLIIFFLPLAICLFLLRRYSLSLFLLTLTLYTYHSARIIVPLTLLSLIIVYRPKIKLSSYLLLLLALPAVWSFVFSNARAADVSIFHPDDNWAAMATSRLQLINSGWPHPLARLVANKITYSAGVFVYNYLSYFSPRFLFISGPAEASYGMLPGIGVLYLIQLPLLVAFFVSKRNKLFYLVFLLLLISPIPAALAKGPGFAANRAAFLVLPLTVISAIGASWLIRRTNFLHFSLILLLSISAGAYLTQYLKVSPAISAHSMGYGFRPAVIYLLTRDVVYDEVRISRSLSEPHIYFAFYMRTSPRKYQVASRSWADFESQGFRFLDQYDGYRLGNLRFGDLNWQSSNPGNILYIGRPADFPGSVPTSVLSWYPDSTPAIVSVARQD